MSMDMMTILLVQCEKERYAIDIDRVQSIQKVTPMHYIPKMPEYVRGMLKKEETIIPIIDAKKILYNRLTDERKQAVFVMYKSDDFPIALIFDRADDVMPLEKSKLSTKGVQMYSQVSYFPAVFSLDDGELITYLDIPNLLETTEGMEEVRAFVREEERLVREKKEEEKRRREEEEKKRQEQQK